jgi:hypothetical protein
MFYEPSADGSTNAATGTFATTLNVDQECRSWLVGDQNATANGWSQDECDVCTEGKVLNFTQADQYEYNFCQCLTDCKSVYNNDNNRRAYFTVGLFFGIWYIVTMMNAARVVKERAMLGADTLPTPTPMMASMLNTFKNKAFTSLLPAWICDAMYLGMFLAVIPYYIRYVFVALAVEVREWSFSLSLSR